jgi:hypothetical protein
MKPLSDPKATPEVRAAAAWALGMVRVNPAVSKYNVALVVYNIGRLAAELGEKVNSCYPEKLGPNSPPNQVMAERWAALLVGPIFQAFNGVDGVRESGLLHAPNLGSSASTVKQIADLVSGVSRAAVELIRGAPGQNQGHKDALSSRVAALKAHLSKNPPKDFHLVPDGPEFRLDEGQEANTAAGAERVAGARGDR